MYPKGASFDLIGYSDLDWVGDKVEWKSTSKACNSLVGPWCVGHIRNKIMYLSPPSKPNMSLWQVVVHNSYG
jgi:hypothetical protein